MQTEAAAYTAEARTDYSAVVAIDRQNKICACSKKQLEAASGKEELTIIGECTGTSRLQPLGTVSVGERALPLFPYKSNSRLRFAEKGYLPVMEKPGAFVALLQPVLPRRVIIAACCAVLLLFVCIFSALAASQEVPQESRPTLDNNAVTWTDTPSTIDGVEDGIRIPGYKSITVDANTRTVSVNFQNPQENNCYFQISLVLLDTDEVLYRSDLIAPGKGIREITMERALEPGTYSASVVYEVKDADGVTPLNGAEVEIELIAA